MIKVGTSGFSYPEWRGPFYPDGLPQQRMLEFYAGHFPAVEINSTYYHIPPPRNMAAMAKRAEGRLEFAVKAHQDMTHSREKVDDALPAFREAIQPLREAGALGCILLQFPFSFKATGENADFLRRIAGELTPDPLVVEFRHRSWTTEETFAASWAWPTAAWTSRACRTCRHPLFGARRRWPTSGFTDGTVRSGGPMRRPGNATTTCTARRNSASGFPRFALWPRPVSSAMPFSIIMREAKQLPMPKC